MINPEIAGQEGIEPVVKVWASLTEETEFIGHCITTWMSKGMALKDIAVVYTSKAVGEAVTKILSESGLDHRYLKNSYQKKHSLSQDARAEIR